MLRELMTMTRRGLVLGLALAALLGCRSRTQAIADSPVGGDSGFLVLPDRDYLARYGLVAGDTLPERKVRSESLFVRELALAGKLATGCVRLFASGARRLFVAQPACGTDPTKLPYESLEVYAPVVRLLDTVGQVVRDSKGDSIRFLGDVFSAMCPAERDSMGVPRRWAAFSPDGCSRQAPVGRWRALPPGPQVGNGVIIANAIGRGMFDQCSRARPDGIDGEWTPTVTDIHALESRLGDYLSRYAGEKLLGPLTDYRRQYGGFTRAGRHFVYVNLFLHHPQGSRVESTPQSEDYWLRSPVLACDGGASFFGLVYDVKSHTFSELSFNGLA